jgi:hypothetical protein
MRWLGFLIASVGAVALLVWAAYIALVEGRPDHALIPLGGAFFELWLMNKIVESRRLEARRDELRDLLDRKRR